LRSPATAKKQRQTAMRMQTMLGLLSIPASERRYGDRSAVALQPLQIAADLRGVLVAQVAVFFERLVNDFFHPRRHVGIEAQRRGRRAIENRIEDNGRSIAPKRHRARRHSYNTAPKENRSVRIELFALACSGDM